MLIVWGRKKTSRVLGYVADFCFLCRGPRAFKLIRNGSVGHVYYISFGEGKLVGYERTCTECGERFAADITTYSNVAEALVPVDELKHSTYPNFDSVMQERIELEKRVQKSPDSLSASERYALIKAPFLLLASKVETQFSSPTKTDWRTGLALFAAIVLPFLAGFAVCQLESPSPDRVDHCLIAAGAAFFVGIAFTAWQIVLSNRRFISREVVPVLAKSLAPLHPSEAEITNVLDELKRLRLKMASKLTTAELYKFLQNSPYR